jgi:tetratricopeptide (TPR) repeat protein
VSLQLSDFQLEQALATIEHSDASNQEKIDMLTEIAMGLQLRPKSASQLFDALTLYNRALELCQEHETSLIARLKARRATCYQMIPEEGCNYLLEARKDLVAALEFIQQDGSPEEIAEVYMNLGLIVQALANFHKAKISDAIMHYQKALHTFTKERFPAEFAILHNNLATAYLAIPMSDERAKMREALAVQSFQAALQVVTLEDDPNEFAMLQNNLGNALQYASSSHVLENNLRALEAYDQALKVRNRRLNPLSYANTISNKANCLRNLPDDPEQASSGNRNRLLEAQALYREAAEIFEAAGECQKTQIVQDMLEQIGKELNAQLN